MGNRRRTWPPTLGADTMTTCVTLTPDGWLRGGRSVAGPLRMGTTPGVGPRGGAVEADYTHVTDFGTDRIAPRDFDPMGTARNRFGDIPSDLIAEQVRGRDRRR